MTVLLMVVLAIGAIAVFAIWPRGASTTLLTILVVVLVSCVIGMFSTAAGIEGSYTGFGFFFLCVAVALAALIIKINGTGRPDTL